MYIVGVIPAVIGSLSNLVQLYLSSNFLNGVSVFVLVISVVYVILRANSHIAWVIGTCGCNGIVGKWFYRFLLI